MTLTTFASLGLCLTTPCSHLYFCVSQSIQVRSDLRLECEATAPAPLFHQRDLASPPASTHFSLDPVQHYFLFPFIFHFFESSSCSNYSTFDESTLLPWDLFTPAPQGLPAFPLFSPVSLSLFTFFFIFIFVFPFSLSSTSPFLNMAVASRFGAAFPQSTLMAH